MVNYEGIFFEGESVDKIRFLEGEPLARLIENLHCTFKYKPLTNEIFDDLVGKEIEVTVVGYGNDGRNSGFEIELPPEIMEYYINYDGNDSDKLKVPHITVSLAKGAKAVDTAFLDFKKLANPFKVTGRFGYFIKEDNNAYVSYEPYEAAKRI